MSRTTLNLRLYLIIAGAIGAIALLSLLGFAGSQYLNGAALAGPTVWELKSVVTAGQTTYPPNILGTKWPPQVMFGAAGDYKGFDGCRSFHGWVTTHGNGGIYFGPITTGQRACFDDQGDLIGPDFSTALQSSGAYQLLPSELRLYDTADKTSALVFRPATDAFLYHGTAILRTNCEFVAGLPLINFYLWMPAWCWVT